VTTIGLISLGCPRNLVDSEVMIGLLKKSGFRIAADISKCDAAVVNTCAFIEDAKKESVDLILQLVQLKKEKKIKSIIVTGCLPQRYPRELRVELPEVDAFLGTGDFIELPQTIRKTLKGKSCDRISRVPSFLSDHTNQRGLITPFHFIYLKLSEGCNNRCTYCIIPRIRGKLRSRRINSLLTEVRGLSKKHKISEINLVGQDTTLYGTDLYQRPGLVKLLKKLTALKMARWIRLLYTHPEHYTDDLIDIIKNEPSICKYIDLPFQHINDRVLKSMNRKTTRKGIMGLIARLKKQIPALAIRTTFIVGFPGETEKEFDELVDFIKQTKFERLGIFEYSREEGTGAYNFKDQIPDKIKKERFDTIMKLQQEVSRDINAGFIGKELEILIDEADVIARSPEGATKQSPVAYSYIGRTEYDAPEVDGNCFVRTKRRHKPGDFVKVKVTDTLEYDLTGEEI